MRAVAAIFLASAALLGPAQLASAQPPWQAADSIRADLAEAQTKQLFGEDGGNEVRSAEASLRGPLRAGLKASAPAELAEIETALASARGAAAQGDEVGLAARRGEITAALRRGAMAVAVDAAARGEVAEARSWMQIRDFRKTTRFTRPGVNGRKRLKSSKKARSVATRRSCRSKRTCSTASRRDC